MSKKPCAKGVEHSSRKVVCERCAMDFLYEQYQDQKQKTRDAQAKFFDSQIAYNKVRNRNTHLVVENRKMVRLLKAYRAVSGVNLQGVLKADNERRTRWPWTKTSGVWGTRS